MSEGLRPHFHQYFEYYIKSKYDPKEHVLIRKITYMCMICGKIKTETYKCYQPPPKFKGSTALKKQKKKMNSE